MPRATPNGDHGHKTKHPPISQVREDLTPIREIRLADQRRTRTVLPGPRAPVPLAEGPLPFGQGEGLTDHRSQRPVSAISAGLRPRGIRLDDEEHGVNLVPARPAAPLVAATCPGRLILAVRMVRPFQSLSKRGSVSNVGIRRFGGQQYCDRGQYSVC